MLNAVDAVKFLTTTLTTSGPSGYTAAAPVSAVIVPFELPYIEF
jgi:hypothetical protein